ncbi:hypothetical protein [Myroides fluvii]|uniref:hypothetical protein n=1 Tax=Myroides fluvii TaxID=2572594 RepID=UPI00131BAC45|nr:hypothetical protein [Myroides fluvii]
MGFLKELLKLITSSGGKSSDTLREWQGKEREYIKDGGNGRNGRVIAHRKRKE